MFSQDEKKNLDKMQVTHPEKLSSDLYCLLNDKRTHDFIIILDSKEENQLFAHKSIVSSRSKKFKKIIFEEFKGKKEVPISGRSYSTMLSVLEYIYTGQTKLDDINVMPILKAADYFEIDSLRLSCFDFLVKSLDKTSVCTMMIKAQKNEYDFKSRELITKCISVLERNTTEIIESDGWLQFDEDVMIEILQSSKLTVNETDLFRATLKWGENKAKIENRSLEKVLEKVIQNIRFPLIIPSDLIKIVKPHLNKVVPLDLYVAAIEFNSSSEALEKSGYNMKTPQFEFRNTLTKFVWDVTLNVTNFTLTNSNLTVTKQGQNSWTGASVFGSNKFNSGKHYFEVILDNVSSGGAGTYIGVTSNTSTSVHTKDKVVGMNGTKYHCTGSNIKAQNGDIIGVLLDFSNLKVKFYLNGIDAGVSGVLQAKVDYTPVVHLYYQNDGCTLSFGSKIPK